MQSTSSIQYGCNQEINFTGVIKAALSMAWLQRLLVLATIASAVAGAQEYGYDLPRTAITGLREVPKYAQCGGTGAFQAV